MKNEQWVCLLLVILALAVGPAIAQETEPAPEAGPPAVAEEDIDVSRIDDILRGEQEVMQGGLLTYDPAGRRDPFRSLLEGFEEPEEGPAATRPPGLAGMLVEELRLEGIVQTPSGILAFVQGRDNVSYIIRPGTKLYNGEVVDIQPKKVIYRQQVNDPKRIKPYEEVVREITD